MVSCEVVALPNSDLKLGQPCKLAHLAFHCTTGWLYSKFADDCDGVQKYIL